MYQTPPGLNRMSDSEGEDDDSESQSEPENSSAASSHRSESRDLTPESQKKHQSNHLRVTKYQIFINQQYRELYDSHVEEVNYPTLKDFDEQLIASQIGISLWTATEKDLFFHLLARKGRHDIKGIATELGSKSEIEVAHYIDLLSKGLTKIELSGFRPRFVNRPQYSAAYELSDDCVSFLGRAAEELQKTLVKEEAREQQSELWLLSPEVNKWVENCLQEPDEEDSELSRTLPAAAFLNLKEFLYLSNRFFMNSSDLEINWNSYATTPRIPTITSAAFSDFHELAISITKRLVESTLYLFMSRMRAVGATEHASQPLIRKKDVLAAVRVLGMTENGRSFWTGVARRNKLRVFEKAGVRTASGRRYKYHEVERLLSDQKNKRVDLTLLEAGDEDMDDIEDQPSDSQSASPPSDNDNDEADTNADADEMDESDDSTHSSPTQQADAPLNQEDAEDQLRDVFLEKLDQRRSQAEEARLWKRLGEKRRASKMNRRRAEEKAKAKEEPQMQAVPRKSRLELVDWTSWTDYAAQWETLETPVPEEAFRENRRLRKGSSGDGLGGHGTES